FSCSANDTPATEIHTLSLHDASSDLKETRFFFFRHGWRIDDDGRSFAPHPVPFCLDDNTSCIICKTENTAVFGEYVAYRLVFCFALRFSLDCTFFVLIVPTIFFHL